VTVAVVVPGFTVVIWTQISLGTPSPPCAWLEQDEGGGSGVTFLMSKSCYSSLYSTSQNAKTLSTNEMLPIGI